MNQSLATGTYQQTLAHHTAAAMDQPPELEQLVARYYQRIRRAAGLLVGDAHDADDLAQETFVQATLSLHRFRGASDPFVWLYGILLNVDRKRRRRVQVWLRNLQHWLDVRGGGAAEMPGCGEGDVIWSFVRELPARQREAVVLRFAEEMSYAEIAEVVHCPEGTAKSRVFHGLKTLRARMHELQCDSSSGFHSSEFWCRDELPNIS